MLGLGPNKTETGVTIAYEEHEFRYDLAMATCAFSLLGCYTVVNKILQANIDCMFYVIQRSMVPGMIPPAAAWLVGST